MYPARRNWNWSFTERDGERAAIISTFFGWPVPTDVNIMPSVENPKMPPMMYE